MPRMRAALVWFPAARSSASRMRAVSRGTSAERAVSGRVGAGGIGVRAESSDRSREAAEVLGQDRVARTEDDRAIDGVAQLAHVAGPAVVPEDLHRRLRERRVGPPARSPAGRGQERPREGLDLAAALAQWRDQQREAVQPVEQIRAEPAGRASSSRSRLVAATKRTSIGRARVDPSARAPSLLEHAQELGLRGAGSSPISSRKTVPPFAPRTGPAATGAPP